MQVATAVVVQFWQLVLPTVCVFAIDRLIAVRSTDTLHTTAISRLVLEIAIIILLCVTNTQVDTHTLVANAIRVEPASWSTSNSET